MRSAAFKIRIISIKIHDSPGKMFNLSQAKIPIYIIKNRQEETVFVSLKSRFYNFLSIRDLLLNVVWRLSVNNSQTIRNFGSKSLL